jgi:hypothetical protein
MPKTGILNRVGEKLIVMKRIFFVFMCLISLSAFAQKTTISSGKGYYVTYLDVSNSNNELIHEVEITDSATSDHIASFTIRLTASSSRANVKQQLTNRTFSGTFTIEYLGNVLVSGSASGGVGQQLTKQNTTAALIQAIVDANPGDEKIACNITTIHNCVAWTIDDMNWIEYGACLVSAPGCYATIWASCGWEVCHNGNPH